MKQDASQEPTVTELYAAYQAAEKASNEGETPEYCRYLLAFMELCTMPATTIADVLAKHEAFLKMELEGQQGRDFEQTIASPLSKLDMTTCAAVSVYKDLRRLASQ